MADLIFRDLLNDKNFCNNSTEIMLSCRTKKEETWKVIRGCYLDDPILEWMDCDLVAVKYEVGSPLLVAVQGTPRNWAKENEEVRRKRDERNKRNL